MIGNNESIEISIKLVSFVLEAMFNFFLKKKSTNGFDMIPHKKRTKAVSPRT